MTIRKALQGRPKGKGRFAIVCSRFNDTITDRLLAGARACLREHHVARGRIDIISVPGAWELPLAAQWIAVTGRYDALIALGCVIRGDTPHFDFVAGEASRGLARVMLDTGVPITFGLLTTDTPEQALARAGGRAGNKGWDAAAAALELADLRRRLRTDEDT